jgi:hypothetical protein
MRAMRRLPFLVLVVLLMLLVSSAAALAAPGGNSAAAHACRQGGFTNVTRDDGTTFRNAGACTSYAARGGTLMPMVSIPARFWIVWNSDTLTMDLFGEGLAPHSDIFTNLTDLTTVGDPFRAVVGQADIDGNFVGKWSYFCLLSPTVFLSGTAADGTPFVGEPEAAPC